MLRVVDVRVIISLQVARAGGLLVVTEFRGLGQGLVIVAADALDAIFQRGDQADMEHAGKFGGDDVGGAADENDAPELGELEQSLRRLPDHGLDGGPDAKDVSQCVLDLGDPILGQELGEVGREIMVGEDPFHEIAVKNGPRGLRARGVLLKEHGEFLRHMHGATAGLAGDGDGTAQSGRGTRRSLGLAVDERRTPFQCCIHRYLGVDASTYACGRTECKGGRTI